MSSVVATQPGWHWAGSIHAYSGTHGSTGQTTTSSPSSSHPASAHGTSTHDTAPSGSQNGSLGQHVNTTA